MFLHSSVFTMPLFSFGLQAKERERRLEGKSKQLNEELLRARRALKSAVTLQVLEKRHFALPAVSFAVRAPLTDSYVPRVLC